ncbi:MAG: cbb3-type cytochrome c oxidase subunit 3 [Hyphomicrobiaceae bacterium]
MTYHTVAGFTQSLALVLFLLVFLGAVLYAIWPGNKAVFDHAARIPLQGDPDTNAEMKAPSNSLKDSGGRNGCA